MDNQMEQYFLRANEKNHLYSEERKKGKEEEERNIIYIDKSSFK